MCPANSNQNKDECEKRGRILCRTFLRPATQAITLDATNFSWAVSGFGQSHEMKYCVTDVKSQYQGILTDIGQGSQSGGTYPYLIKQDFFHLRVVTPKQLTAAILLLVCNDMRFFSFFPRIIKVSVRPGSYIAFSAVSNSIRTKYNEANHLIIYCLNCIRHGRNATYEPGLKSLNMLCMFTTRFIYQYGIFGRKLQMQKTKLACSVGKQTF